METDVSFADRMFMGGEAVYTAIEQGQYSSPSDVDAALMDTQLAASQDR
jgi:hypothetical protein